MILLEVARPIEKNAEELRITGVGLIGKHTMKLIVETYEYEMLVSRTIG